MGFILLGIIIAVGGLFFFDHFFKENIKFSFYINETEERLEGSVYFEDPNSKERNLLGFAQKGVLEYDKSSLYPGNIIFSGEYGGIPFEYSYILSRDDLDYGEVDYILTQEEINELNFVLMDEQIKKYRNEIFDLMNYEREKRDIEKLLRSSKLDKIAQEYSERMLKENFYAHTDPQGRNHYDRLQEEKVFYKVATENLDRFLAYSDTNLGEAVVYGWIKSPEHSIAILDEENLWSSVGIGLSCEKLNENIYYTCYAVALFARLHESYVDENLKYHWVQMMEIYPEEYDFNYNNTINLKFSSSSSMRLIFTKDKSDFDSFVNRGELRGVISQRTSSNYNDIIQISKGYYLILNSNVKDTSYNLSIEYNY